MVINIKENIQFNVMLDISIPLKRYFCGLHKPLLVNFSHSPKAKFSGSFIITHLAGQTYVLHSCKWNFASPQIYLQPAKIKSQHFGVLLKFLVCN